MALITCDFFSESLGLSCSMKVILPQPTVSQIGMRGVVKAKKHPVLWLLHGLSDDHTIWGRRTSIERYVAETGIAVVMPNAGKSFYKNMATGPAYGTFLKEELPKIAQSFFPLSPDRRDNFVAGLSMGGYGAFLLALSQPERFAAAASLSGVLDIANLTREVKETDTILRDAFGAPSGISGSDYDLLHLATKATSSRGPIPQLYACCGSEDFLLAGNHRFVAHAGKIGLPITYEEHEGASHEWAYWDRQIEKFLCWLLVREKRAG